MIWHLNASWLYSLLYKLNIFSLSWDLHLWRRKVSYIAVLQDYVFFFKINSQYWAINHKKLPDTPNASPLELYDTFKKRGRGLHTQSLVNSYLLYKDHSVSKVFHTVRAHTHTHTHTRTKEKIKKRKKKEKKEVGKGEKKGMAKYITKKLISTVFIWNIIKYNNL